jgi:hypothetical protein
VRLPVELTDPLEDPETELLIVWEPDGLPEPLIDTVALPE